MVDHKIHIRCEGTPYIHVGDHTIPVPYKIKGIYIHVGDNMISIPYKVWGTITGIQDMKTLNT